MLLAIHRFAQVYCSDVEGEGSYKRGDRREESYCTISEIVGRGRRVKRA